MSLQKSSDHVSLPPRTKALISVRLTNKATRRFGSNNAIIEPFIITMQRGFYVAKALIEGPIQNRPTCRVFNSWNKTCKIPRNFVVATMSSVTGDEIDTNSMLPGQHSSGQTPYSATCLRPSTACMDGRRHHSTGVGTDEKCCCCSSANRVETVNTRSQTDLRLAALQKNLTQQAETVRGRTDGSHSNNICSGGSHPSKQQQGSTAVSRTAAESRLAGEIASQQQAGLANKTQTPLLKKVEHLRSRDFLIDDCDAIDEAFPDFIDLLYSFQDIFPYAATDIAECNLLKCQFLTYPDAKPVRYRPYGLNDKMRKHVDKQLDKLLTAGVIT